MCCIFTCCGWMIDLLQRVWTFAMSCCISSAICCVMMSSSLSGIALGYNYSLAEYIDLKETNVSVYLKRGVFDDEIADDLDWRRAGHLPVAGHINDDNLITGAPDGEEQPLRSGRRLDDSVFDSGGDHNKFEGSLMKLTAKPLDEPITPVSYTPDMAMQELHNRHPPGSMDRVKAIQEVLNKRRHDLTSTAPVSPRRRVNVFEDQNAPQNPSNPPTPNIWPDILSGRRFDPHDPSLETHNQDLLLNPARTAVPPRNIGGDGYWKVPYLASSTRGPTVGLYNAMVPRELPTHPPPIKFDWGPIRPSTTNIIPRPTNTPESVRVITMERIPEIEAAKSAEEFDRLGQRMGGQDLERARQRLLKDNPGSEDEDYDIDPRGIPSRKKRRTVSTKFPDVITVSGRKIHENDMDGKAFPNRYKREVVSHPSSDLSTLEKLSKSSDVFREETVKINRNDRDTTEVISRKKRNIISSTISISTTFYKLSKLSDVFRTETVPKMNKNDINDKEIAGRNIRHIVASSSSVPSFLDKLSKSSDIFRGETLRLNVNDMDDKEVPSRKKRPFDSISSTIPSTLGKLSKSSDIFRTETVPIIHENNMYGIEIQSGKKRHIVSSSSNIPPTLGKLSKSSDVFHTKTGPKIFETDMDSKITQNKLKALIISNSGTISSTAGKLSRSSDIFHTETVPKIFDPEIDSKRISNKLKRKITSYTATSSFGKLSKFSDILRAEFLIKTQSNDVNSEDIPNAKEINKENVNSISSKSSDVFHTETIYNKRLGVKEITERTTSSNSGYIPKTLGKQNSKQNSKVISSLNSISVTLDKLSESSDVQTENVLEIDKNDVNIKIRKRRRITPSSSILPSTPSKFTSDVINSEITNKIHKKILVSI